MKLCVYWWISSFHAEHSKQAAVSSRSIPNSLCDRSRSNDTISLNKTGFNSDMIKIILVFWELWSGNMNG